MRQRKCETDLGEEELCRPVSHPLGHSTGRTRALSPTWHLPSLWRAPWGQHCWYGLREFPTRPAFMEVPQGYSWSEEWNSGLLNEHCFFTYIMFLPHHYFCGCFRSPVLLLPFNETKERQQTVTSVILKGADPCDLTAVIWSTLLASLLADSDPQWETLWCSWDLTGQDAFRDPHMIS